MTLRASYAKGFRAPSLRELYYVFVDVNHQIYGNTHLKAEQSDTWNFSATYRLQNENEVLDIIGKGYYNDIKNLVDFAFSEMIIFLRIYRNFKSVGVNLRQFLSSEINAQLGFSYIGNIIT